MIGSKIAQNSFPPLLCNLLYNLGRIGSYLCIGALCGGIGMVFEINSYTKGGALIFIGILISLFGVFMLFSPKYLSKIEPSLAEMKGFRAFFVKIYTSRSLKSFFFLGLLNGFLPCGIVYYFALVALASGEMWQGVAIMGIFGISTLFPMLFVGILSSILLTSKLKQIMLKLSSIAMILFGIYMICKGVKLF